MRAPMLALTEELAAEFGQAQLFRPYRDVRFAKDKSPYKTHQGAFVDLTPGIGLYVEVSAGGLFAAGGCYTQAVRPGGPLPRGRRRGPVRQAARTMIDGLAARRRLRGLGGDRLKTRPRGVADDHPRLDLLRHRSLHAGSRFEPEPWVHTPRSRPGARHLARLRPADRLALRPRQGERVAPPLIVRRRRERPYGVLVRR